MRHETKNDHAKWFFPLMLLAALMMRPESISAQPLCSPTPTCGCSMTSNLTLQSNLGPCPGTGFFPTAIVVQASGVTLDLNGFTIIGPSIPGSNSQGVVVNGGSTNVTILSGLPGGSITGFDRGGILVGAPGGNTIKNVTLSGNSGADITLFNSSNGNHVMGNTLTSAGRVGILIDNGFANTISKNSISGHTALGGSIDGNQGVGIEIHIGGGSIIDHNMVTGNGNGLVMDGFSGNSTITSNHICDNTQDGMWLRGGNTLVADNDVCRNARWGIEAFEENLFTITKNRTNGNGVYGIALGSSVSSPSAGSDNKITDNAAHNNGVDDLFWDLNGVNNCWAMNHFGTSSPTNLPPCP